MARRASSFRACGGGELRRYLKAQIAHSVNPADAIKRLRERLTRIPNVVKDPAPSVEVLEFTAFGPVLAVRPFCHNDHYWDVYFATNQAIVEEFTSAGYAVPAENRVVQTPAAAAQSRHRLARTRSARAVKAIAKEVGETPTSERLAVGSLLRIRFGRFAPRPP